MMKTHEFEREEGALILGICYGIFPNIDHMRRSLVKRKGGTLLR